jgi:hypothetical protein
VAVLLIGASASATLLTGPAAAAGTPLVGTFTITAGSCSGGTASGTYLRMVLSGGTNAAGPYFSNSDSTCSDNSYTPLAPGASGGLVTGSYQPQPSPAFDSSGNALADQITAPVAFEGVKFGTATNSTDPQTGLHAPAPSITANGSALSGDVAAFGVSWNNQEFNQGSPKPDGSSPGNTTPVVGTYDAATGAYTLQWSSQVVGGPFNGFSAFWNLTGRFIPAASSPAGSSGNTAASAGGNASPAGQSSAVNSISGSGATPGGTSGAGSNGKGTGGGKGAGTVAVKSGSQRARATALSRAGSANVLSARTTTSGGGGWHFPWWSVALVALLGVLGLSGVLWSERGLRGLRSSTVSNEGE